MSLQETNTHTSNRKPANAAEVFPTTGNGYWYLNLPNMLSLTPSTDILIVEDFSRNNWLHTGTTLESFPKKSLAIRKLDWWQNKIDM